ncbi:hypothetical protein AWJ20_3809 [Sugiyamaella lignohabitans]|uniref:Uncharacterized protein n=1 Tax=Sugiyamaella lignohabitans TaxID=796027 RepID=A0A167BZE2_9ASCO|nr:uncharacterized protein AWJ20_3809 [Sugiyamaella lignohabitans]ANB11014.1 hypothetical protein AWJ20_3809 [Sugiyamaella lignohabitans]
MGNTDSKLRFRTHISRLFELDNISADDRYYWVKYWTEPNSVFDVFTLLSSADIRKTRDGNLANLETLIKVVYFRLKELRNSRSFPHNDIAPAKELLNCVRILTKILPFVYEKDTDEIREWEEKVFWQTTSDKTSDTSHLQGIAPDLINITLDLLFIEGFTIPIGQANSSIWEPGVGSNTVQQPTHEMLSNRVEILRFLLTLVSDCLYQNQVDVAVKGSKYLTYVVTNPDKRVVMTVLCSLLNTSLRYSPAGKVPYDHMLISDRNRQLVIYSVQLLVVLLVYPIPEVPDFSIGSSSRLIPKSGSGRKQDINMYRYFLSKIRHPEDFQFIIDNLLKLISQPILLTSSLLPGSQTEVQWVTELLALFWELTQCNRKFRDYLYSGSATDFMIFLLAYVQEKYQDASQREVVRLSAYILLYLSSDSAFVKLLRYKVEVSSGSDDINGNLRRKYISSKSKMSIFSGTYGDYLINQLLHPLLSSGSNNDPMFDFLAPTFMEIIYNISPFTINISYSTASNLVQLFSNLISSNYIITASIKEFLLLNILKVFSNLIHFNFRSNKNLLFVILKNESKFRFLHNSTKDGDSDGPFVIEDEDGGIDGPSEASSSKSKGKQPVKAASSTPMVSAKDSSSRVSDLWTLVEPIIMIVEDLRRQIPYTEYISTTNTQETKVQPHIIIDSIGNIPSVRGVDLDQHEPADFEPIRFNWNSISLGWYESIIWGDIFRNESQLILSTINEVATSLVSPRIGSVGVWNGTNIKLFRLQEAARQGPSLLRPKGAVDAVAESVLQQFGKLTH